MLCTDTGDQIGIFKALRNTSTKENPRDRQVKAEYMSWLLAKAAGLTRVVNPVIPVRIQGNSLVIDPENYDGTLEPFVGLPIREYPKGNPRAMDNYSKALRQLYSRALNYGSIFSVSLTNILEKQQEFNDFLFYKHHNQIDGLSSLFKRREKSSRSLFTNAWRI